MNQNKLQRARIAIGIVAAGLFLSGVTCYFLTWEVKVAIWFMEALSLDAAPIVKNEGSSSKFVDLK